MADVIEVLGQCLQQTDVRKVPRPVVSCRTIHAQKEDKNMPSQPSCQFGSGFLPLATFSFASGIAASSSDGHSIELARVYTRFPASKNVQIRRWFAAVFGCGAICPIGQDCRTRSQRYRARESSIRRSGGFFSTLSFQSWDSKRLRLTNAGDLTRLLRGTRIEKCLRRYPIFAGVESDIKRTILGYCA